MTDIAVTQLNTVRVYTPSSVTNVKANISTVSTIGGGDGVWLQQTATNAALTVFGGFSVSARNAYDGIRCDGVSQGVYVLQNGAVSGGNAVAFFADGFLLSNSGTITGFTHGVYIDTLVSGTVTNNGMINGGIGSLSDYLTINNFGTINGGITAASDSSLATFDLKNNVGGVVNGGVAFSNAAGVAAAIYNLGTVSAADGDQFAITGSAGDEKVVNKGMIVGDISLGEGNDQYFHHFDINGATLSGTVYGGGGNDLYHLSGAVVAINEKLNEGTDTLELELINGNYTLSDDTHIEIIKLLNGTANATGNKYDNTIIGNLSANDLSGGDGNDSLFGGSGNDILHGGNGDNTLNGGVGDDTYYVVSSADKLIDESGNDTVYSTVDFTLVSGIESIKASDEVMQVSIGVTFVGNDDANSLEGGKGNDFLDGGAGIDTMVGNDGDDTYVVDDIGDIVTENDTNGIDTVQSSVGFTLGANIENLTLLGSDNLSGFGNSTNNVLIGNSGNNDLAGFSGDDVLDGGLGSDTLNGGEGNDTYIVDGAMDDIIDSGGKDTIKSSASSFILQAGIENLTLTGGAAIKGTGNALANVLIGNAASNALFGMAGNDNLNGGTGSDKLDGGFGQDKLYGGTGADDFIFRAKETGTSRASADTIYDFTGVDDIDLHFVDANSKASGNQPFHFIGKNAFSGHAGELRFEKSSSDTYIYADTNGDRKADLVIHLDDAVNITKSHFIL